MVTHIFAKRSIPVDKKKGAKVRIVRRRTGTVELRCLQLGGKSVFRDKIKTAGFLDPREITVPDLVHVDSITEENKHEERWMDGQTYERI